MLVTLLSLLNSISTIAATNGIQGQSITEQFENRRIPTTYKGPVIGILTQKTNGIMENRGHSYIAASYVKFLEMAGAQVIPVFDSMSEVEMARILGSVNGMLLPGGAQKFPDSQFYNATKFIYHWVVQQNGEGTYFPLWGTCLGFQALLYIAAEAEHGKEIRFRCDSRQPDNLTLHKGAKTSRLLRHMKPSLFSSLQHHPLVYNCHNICISKETIEEHRRLRGEFRVIATNSDALNREYAAMIEHRSLPIYATQFHAEKSLFEWTVESDIPHGRLSVEFTQHLANFFVTESRRNRNKFANATEFYLGNINNYSPEYTLVTVNSTLESCYFFNDERRDLGVNTSDEFSLLDDVKRDLGVNTSDEFSLLDDVKRELGEGRD